MRVLVIGDSPETVAASADLEAAGLQVQRRPDAAPAGDPEAEIAEIARNLRELEPILGDGSADAVLIASSSPAALAAVLVATKLGTPVARLAHPGEELAESTNARLIEQLADTTFAGGTQAIIDWVRDSYAPGT